MDIFLVAVVGVAVAVLLDPSPKNAFALIILVVPAAPRRIAKPLFFLAGLHGYG